jgi:hypothetical protein
LIYDINLSLRSNSLEASSSPYPPVLLYFYRNTLWNPPSYGDWINLNMSGSVDVDSPYTYRIYHNTFVGSNGGVSLGGLWKMSRLLIVNNIIQGTSTAYTVSPGFICNERSDLAASAYNWTKGSTGNCPWHTFSGNGNISSNSNLFSDTALPSSLTLSGTALNAGIDISQPFKIDGTTYSPLPGFSSSSSSVLGAGTTTTTSSASSSVRPSSPINLNVSPKK